MKPLDLFTNVVRAQEIVTVSVRYGFGDFLSQLGFPKNWFKILVPEHVRSMNVWQRIRVAFEELGPTFVKFGQILSTRPDLLPEPLISEFKQLRNQVTPLPWEEMEPVFLAETQGDPQLLFSQFNRAPIACGSIGQVYAAELGKDKKQVAVKIQKPNIKKAIKADLEIIGWLARQVDQKVEDLQAYAIPDIVQEAARGILQELDFTIEARNAILFNTLNPEPECVFAPKVYDDFTTARLTVTEWIDGSTPDHISVDPEQAKHLAILGGNSVFHQIVIAGFFHADPHGGNILITQDQRLCFIDWGLAGLLTREMRYFLADLFSAIASLDAEKVMRIVTTTAVTKKRIDRSLLEKEVSFVLRKYQARFQRNEAIGNIMFELLYIFGKNGIQLARDYSLLAKAIISIEETGIALDPTFDIRKIAGPYLKKLNYERWNPVNVAKSTYWSLQSHLSRLRELPGDMQRFFRHLEDGDISFTMKHEGLSRLSSVFDSGINRLVLGIIVSALLIASSLIISSTIQAQPNLLALPTSLGTLGYGLSFFFGVVLIYDIIRHGRHK